MTKEGSGEMDDFSLRVLLAERAGEGLDLYARHSNPRFVQILRIIGFDRQWARAEGAIPLRS